MISNCLALSSALFNCSVRFWLATSMTRLSCLLTSRSSRRLRISSARWKPRRWFSMILLLICTDLGEDEDSDCTDCISTSGSANELLVISIDTDAERFGVMMAAGMLSMAAEQEEEGLEDAMKRRILPRNFNRSLLCTQHHARPLIADWTIWGWYCWWRSGRIGGKIQGEWKTGCAWRVH